MSARTWLRALRPLAHGNIAPPILLGQAFAVAQGRRLDPVMLVAAHAFGVLAHAFIVFANDYADREADALNDSPTLVSGGSRVLVEGLLAPRALLGAAIGAAVLLVAGSVAGLLAARPLAPLFALATLALTYLYSFGPRLSYAGFGEVLQGLGLGVVLPLLGYYLQAGQLAGAPFDHLAPLFLLGFAGNIVTALPDAPADARASKRSWPVRRGQGRARRDALVSIAGAVALAGYVAARELPPEAVVAFAAAPALCLVVALRSVRRADVGRRRELVRFVLLLGGAGVLLQVGWALVLFTSG